MNHVRHIQLVRDDSLIMQDDAAADCILAIHGECERLERERNAARTENIALRSMLRGQRTAHTLLLAVFIATWMYIFGYLGYLAMKQIGWVN